VRWSILYSAAQALALSVSLVILLPTCADATAISFTGNLAAPDDAFTTSFTLTEASLVTVQTWGFGGGTNADGALIAAGGFDPLIALFQDTGSTATILTNAVGDPIFSADLFPGFEGLCPPGHTDLIGEIATCGDASLSVALGVGTYTLLLTHAPYMPRAVNPGLPGENHLGDGFTDLTGGVFQTCASLFDCSDRTNAFAFDITLDATDTQVPEPTSFVLMATGGLALLRRRWDGRGR
jgi:hypothetical protein